MKKIHLVFVISCLICIKAQSKNFNIYFEANSSKISSLFNAQLDSLVSAIKLGSPLEQIGLSGHADTDASELYNQQLSYERAVEVKKYLLDKGVLNVIHLDAKGENEPINSNLNEKEKAQNRRVEVVRNYSNNNDVFNFFEQAAQLFTITATKDTILLCTNGTSIDIKKNIFETPDDKTPIKIKVQEFTSKKDFVLNNLCTNTLDGKMLESRGMINIEAYQNNKQLNLKKDNTIAIGFKDRSTGDQTKLFYGTSHAKEIRWEEASDNTTPSTIRSSGKSWTTIGGDIIDESDWEFVDIKGEKFKIVRSKKKNKITIDTIAVENEQFTSELMLKSQKLGWINCDRFYNDPAPKIDLIVSYDGSFVPNVIVLFDDINAVMPYTYREGNKLIFKNIPANKKITFIGLHKLKESENILFAYKKTTSSSNAENIEFKNSNKSEIEHTVIGI